MRLTTIEVRPCELRDGDVWSSPTGRLWLLSDVRRRPDGTVSARASELGRASTADQVWCEPSWSASDFVEILLAERPG